eukprot:TRINITY_DN4532_c0_g1_i1.p1 TRINITY_DN4532_c0_g1~~TRINITY_DN4532_c0_g1_i1.p1  ORF type:complete len:117 (-),score=26.63 TRINITY_DN4532_c0_g1_i1:129-479(-)
MSTDLGRLEKERKTIEATLEDEKALNDKSRSAFEKADSNKDGHLDRSEVISVLGEVLGAELEDTGVTDEHIDYFFKKYDTNNNGSISKEEFVSFAKDALRMRLVALKAVIASLKLS